ncbi:MAG TPA: beta-ketoacyl synthase N-terminal-like domain-containing protein [Myxococcota bacterium]
MNPRVAEPIAIIGIGLRFPGGVRGPEEFWRMLREGRSGISEPPAHRVELGFNIDEIYDPRPGTPGKISSKLAGFLDHPELFDPFVFGLSPRDVVAMEPQQRYALEVVADALDDAGIPHDALMGERVAVIFGRMNEDYSREHIAVLGEDRFRRSMDVWGAAGITGSVLSGRISFWLGTRGPSFFIDTACSTSLLAVHLACQSLWSGETHTAIAGGVNVFLTPEGMIALSRVGMMAPDGKIKAFDDRANGFVRAEGAGAVILRPLAAALANGDPIHAVIRGTGFSADGRDGGHMMAPGRYGQAQAIRDAYERAGIAPSDVHFVEAHGTGTIVGDPVEVRALADVMGPGRAKDRPLLISSVKGNIGHAEPASGVAGLIKATLAVEHRELPPQVNFETPSRAIPWDEVPVRVQAKLAPWPYPERALAGVNSFGISGTNAHVVLEGAPDLPALPGDDGRARLVVLSAHTDRALVELADAVREDAARAAGSTLRDIAYTHARRRTLRGNRLALVARDREELASELAGFLSGAPSPTTASGVASGKPAGVVFAFSGHGTHWAGMGKRLLSAEPVFAAAIDAWDRAQGAHVSWSLRDLLERAVGGAELDRIDVLQPALTGIAIALARQWESWGVKPAAVIGHSSGEIAAAHIAGAISLADAAQIACARGAVVRELAPAGAMALVALPAEAVAGELERVGNRAAVAGANSPSMTVLSGDIDAIEAVVAAFDARGVFARKLRVEFASHGPHMDALAPELTRRVASVVPSESALPFFSTVTPGVVAGSSLTPTYWGENLRQPVRFADAAAGAIAAGHTTFLEIGPNPVLKLALEEVGRAAKQRVRVAASLRRDGDDAAEMLASLGALFCAGASVDFARLHPEGRVVATPLYPFQREEYWFGAKRGIEGKRASHPFAGMIGANATELEAASGGERFWQIDLFREALGAESKRDSEIALPSAELLATALGLGARLWPGDATALEGFELSAPITLPKRGARTLQLAAELRAHDAELRFASRLAGSGAAFTQHAACRVLRAPNTSSRAAELGAIRARCPAPETRDAFYAALDASGLAVAKERRVLREASFGAGEALAKLSHLAPLARNEAVAPLLLDVALQLLARLAERSVADPLSRFEPSRVASLALGSAAANGELFAHARLAQCGEDAPGEVSGEVALLDARGALIAQLRGVALERCAKPVKAEAGPFLYEIAWRPLAENAADEPQRALRDGVMSAPRLVPLALPAMGPRREAAGGREFAAEAAEPTRLAGAVLRETASRAPGPGELAIEVRAAGLSFLDVLQTFGLERDECARGLGCEVAGVVREIGRGVTGFAVGDEVLGFARGALASRVIADAPLVAHKPAGLGFEQAAALPLARAVAQYALLGIARVRAGERVLVHSAGGAIGHAAVALARRAGAEVVATAGSERKRASLRAHGAAAVADSRAAHVAENLLASSAGRGFDVAFDLAGDGAPLAALAAGGRYVAIDRTGHAAESAPRAPRRNLSLHSLDPRGLIASKPEELAAALRASLASASPAELAGTLVTVFPVDQLGRAIRFMAQARHIGKVVVSFALRGEARIAPLAARERIANGALLAIGEIEAFPALAHWIAAQKPRELVRMGEGESLEAAGAKLSVPLAAVVFAPSVADAPAAAARARSITAFASERGAALIWLVSDASATIGADASAEAAKQSASLADLARARRAQGEAVTALELGIGDAITPGALAQLTRIGEASVTACVLHASAPEAWDAGSSPLLRELGAANASGASKLASASPEERRASLREAVGAALAIVLRLGAADRARIDWQRPLAELGLDSLMGVELHTRIEEAAGLEIPPAVLFAEPNLEAVVERLARSIGGGA